MITENRSDGDILSDVSETTSWDDLRKWVTYRDKWRSHVRVTRSRVKVTVKTGVFVPEFIHGVTVPS